MTAIDNVFWCEECETGATTKRKTKKCAKCRQGMTVIGWFEFKDKTSES